MLNLSLGMFSIIGSGTYRPEVGLHGLFAVRRVLLREERCLVRRGELQAVLTSSYGCCDSGEAYAETHLLGRHRSRAGYGAQAADVEAGASRAGGFGYTVGCQDHLLVTGVLRLFVDFGEGTADGLDRVSPFYFCHNSLRFRWLVNNCCLCVGIVSRRNGRCLPDSIRRNGQSLSFSLPPGTLLPFWW